jgi:hypothetical protein
MDALSTALLKIDQRKLKAELSRYVPGDAQRILAAAGVRDEHVFPAPSVLEKLPTLVGYYRLLLGASQKRFYAKDTGMSHFMSMEKRGVINKQQKVLLPEFCKTMGEQLADLVRQMSPAITNRDVAELPVLTLGSQFQGGKNVAIGKQAIENIFLSIRETVMHHIMKEDARRLTLRNSAGRTVIIALSADPDVRVQEDIGGKFQNKVAIEIKGGTDRSNAYNRAGEAEKSHQKAKGHGFHQCWTIIAKKGIELKKLETGSPTTNAWFDAAQVLGREGEDWEEFRLQLSGQVGIPLALAPKKPAH